MADTKFKVGDTVKILRVTTCDDGARSYYEGFIGTKHEVKRVGVNNKVWLGVGSSSGEYSETLWYPTEVELVLNAPKSSPKFILQYELDADPFEFFATENEARKRIAELAERTDLKRDSIRLIEIRKIRTVKLGTKITISK